jgi:hypothetical protein
LIALAQVIAADKRFQIVWRQMKASPTSTGGL